MSGPTVRRRRLAAELRALREASRLKLGEVAAATGLSESTISRIETGQSSARAVNLNALLDLYRVTDPQHRDLLRELARDGSKRGWWAPYSDVIESGLGTYVGLETDAEKLRSWEPAVVSGLLQTEEYARAVLREFHPRQAGGDLDRLVQLRMQRQERLGAGSPFDLWLILDEAVLHRVVGGQAIMAGQLGWLLRAADRPGVTIQVLPFEAGANAGMRGAFSVLTFLIGEPAVYVESQAGIIILEKPGELDTFRSAFDYLSASALSAAASRDRIARASRDFENLPRTRVRGEKQNTVPQKGRNHGH